MSLLISEECTNSGISLIINGTITVITSIITYIIPMKFSKYIYPFIFTSYSDGTSIIDGVLNYNLNTTNVTLTLGIIVCLLWTALFYYITRIRFLKKDVV